ncbi:MAG: acyl-CoA thioesterase [Anaerolineae bacterium]|nr:acyl-CoA thioesterase [Thermoflexus sp.]MDW8065099.1 acyl-CoA thioesterase [Anaerolineae bacterium]
MEGKRVRDSEVVLTQFMQPEHANILGNIHGGWIMKLMDEAGAIVSSRHARRPTVTAVVDSIQFCAPIHVGNLVHVRARLTRAWRTSMEAEIRVEAENLLTGERRVTATAYFVYVALDRDGRPTPVPPLILETEEERRKAEEADQRRAERLARREIATARPAP